MTGGNVIGKTDRHAAYPITKKFAPWDVTATIFSALGIDSDGHYLDLTNRPYRIASGQPIVELYGSSAGS